MNAQQAENLRILIRHMENVCTRTLDMEQVFKEQKCKTPACAIGEAYVCVPALRAQFNRQPDGANYGDLARDVFGVAYRLFGSPPASYVPPGFVNAWKRNDVTPKEWATEARKVLTEHGYAMDDGFAAFKARILAPLPVEA